jgi:hypothetical protein
MRIQRRRLKCEKLTDDGCQDSVNKSLLALRHSYELKEYNNYCKNKYLQKEAHKIVEFLIWPILVLTLLGNLAKDNVSFCHHLTSVVC